MEQREITESGG